MLQSGQRRIPPKSHQACSICLLINLAATWYMTGLIWFVQFVHYPLFADVEAEQFTTYHKRHMDTTGWAVGPAMMVEMFSGFALLVWRPRRFHAVDCVVGVGGIVIALAVDGNRAGANALQTG